MNKAFNFEHNTTKDRNQFSSVEQVWAAIDSGKEVFWGNDSYHLTVEIASPYNAEFAKRGCAVLRVTCIENYFGSILTEEELPKLYCYGPLGFKG